jgi:hypothetical protein
MTAGMKLTVAVNERGHRIGESHHNARYSDHEIDLMWRMRAEGLSYGKLAVLLEMPKSTIASIIRGHRRCQCAARHKTVEAGQKC